MPVIKFDFKIILSLVILGVAGFFIYQSQAKNPPTSKLVTSTPNQNQLKLLSTDPDPLEAATLLPTQTITLTFNQVIPKSELKYHFDPDVEHQLEVASGPSSSGGTTFKITFKKPLELGSGYTLFIESSTHTKSKVTLDREYVYHFRTINYRGI